MSESLRHPQLEPSDHCYVILQDHGPNEGGWGPAAVQWPGFGTPRPFVYTGPSEDVLVVAESVCRALAQATGKPTRLVCYRGREDVAVFGGSS